MDKMYLFKNENEITEYDGSPLRFYVGKKLIKQIFSPTEDELKDFGYKKLIMAIMPEYDEKTQYLNKKYVDGEDITEEYEVCGIPEEVFGQEEDMPDKERENLAETEETEETGETE